MANPTNADILRELREVGVKVDRIEKFNVGDAFDPESKRRSLDGRVTAIEAAQQTILAHQKRDDGRIRGLEARMEVPPIKKAEAAQTAANEANERAAIAVKFGKVTVYVTASAALAFILALLGVFPWFR